MKNQNNSGKLIGGIISILVALVLVSCGLFENSVAQDEIEQYEICVRNNDHIGASVHAGIAAAAFLQAGDEAGYQKWHAIEQAEMDKATEETMMEYGLDDYGYDDYDYGY